ncbi:MAG TPA: 60S ribosomal export protein NMD3 [Methanomicrobiales archaeon]|nr:60S ribosomal export protein NMD3 [Methanomicrobiales archaeon]
MREIQESFCPRCGRPSVGICDQCRVEGIAWITCDPRMESVLCPTCGAVKQTGAWADTSADRQVLAEELAIRAVHLHKDVRDVHISVRTRDTSPNRTIATTDVSGTLYTVPVSHTCRTEIFFMKEQCTRCNRIKGGYYEAVVQVRAKDRVPTPREVEVAGRIACDLEKRMQESGDRLSFVSDIDEIKEGVDIVAGTQALGQAIALQVTTELGGRFTTHPKLVGEKEGKPLYRITYSVRLPFYQKGDVLFFENRYYEVREVENQYLRVFDLQGGSMKTLPDDRSGRLVGNVRDAEPALVAYKESGTLGIMDPATYTTREIKPLSWLSPEAGSTVRVLRDREREELILVG